MVSKLASRQQHPKYNLNWEGIIGGSIFMAIGMLLLLFAVVVDLIKYWQINAWSLQQATITQFEYKVIKAMVRPKGSRQDVLMDVEALHMAYTYLYEGKQYQSSDIDNKMLFDQVDDYSQELLDNLYLAFVNHFPVQVWVDPDNPQRALLSHDLRFIPHLVAIFSVFVLFGGGILCLSLAISPNHSLCHEGLEAKPWLTYVPWCKPERHPLKNRKIFWLALVGFYGNLASLAFWYQLPLLIAEKNLLALIVSAIFPVAGLGIVIWLLKILIDQRRLGSVVLKMDPYPGAIGGHVGGSLDIKIAYHSANYFLAKLKCFLCRLENNYEVQEVVWQQEVGVMATQSEIGTALQFYFKVPDGLPESQIPSDHYHWWCLELVCNNEKVKFNRRFMIPVFATRDLSSISQNKVSSEDF